MRPGRLGLILLVGLVASCSEPAPIDVIGAGGRPFDPVAFFRGDISSWGVLENRSGEPTDVVRTEGTGVPEGADGVHFPQTVHVGSQPAMVRDWHMRRVGPHRFEATANDIVGTAEGEASGSAFHWNWTLALHPGNPLTNVNMEQWWYLQNDGTMLNRTVITKLGIVVAEVTEVFSRK